MIGASLETLVVKVKADIGASTSAAIGINALPAIQQTIRRNYERLRLDFNWPHLFTSEDIELEAGQRYYNLPTTIEFERIESVRVKWLRDWGPPLEYGIDDTLYNVVDSDEDEREDPVRRWYHHGTNQFEVWPVPSSNEQKLRFRGVSKAGGLVANADQADIDDTLIILASAAELLTRYKSADAQAKLAEYTTHYARLRGRNIKGRVISLGPRAVVEMGPRYGGRV
jgi:hypothetical protein